MPPFLVQAVTASQEELDLVAEQEEEERNYQSNFLILRVVVRSQSANEWCVQKICFFLRKMKTLIHLLQ